MEYPSQLVERAVEEMARLPGIGKKTALRMVLHLLKKTEDTTRTLSEALLDLRINIKYCNTCHVISDSEKCKICNSAYTDDSVICVVEDAPDVLAIQNTGQYNGLFHVLGGKISPMDGIGSEHINIDSLIGRVKENKHLKEIILALSATMEGDTTAYYIKKLLSKYQIKVTSIARGIPVGSELEYADELTLGRSITTRTLLN